jgi:hypothetical protein
MCTTPHPQIIIFLIIFISQNIDYFSQTNNKSNKKTFKKIKSWNLKIFITKTWNKPGFGAGSDFDSNKRPIIDFGAGSKF